MSTGSTLAALMAGSHADEPANATIVTSAAAKVGRSVGVTPCNKQMSMSAEIVDAERNQQQTAPAAPPPGTVPNQWTSFARVVAWSLAE